MASIVTNRTAWALMLLSIVLILAGCSKPAVINGVMPVEIGDQTFELEIVADNDTRELGLGERKEMDADKGMLFAFPDSKLRNFVMRDCYIDIDIIFLDSAGRITSMHHMPIEDPIGPDETRNYKIGNRTYSGTYDIRLKKYSSRFNAQYAIELVGGMLEKLDLENGQLINLDTDYLETITQ